MLLTALSAAARAQIRLPALPLSGLPPQSLTQQSLSQTLDPNEARTLERLSGLRHLEIVGLVRANRAVIETDPHGEPIVRNEILALSPSDAALERARSAGFLIAREQTLAAADLRLVVLTAPPDMSTKRALKTLREADPAGVYDYNHIYTHAGGSPAAPDPAAATPPPTAPASPVPPAPAPSGQPHIRIGLLDTGVDSSHPIFRNSVVHAWGCSNKLVPDLHGTAVASLMLAHAVADLYAADVYCGVPTGGAVDTIVAALAWMASEHVAVINISLVGPRNVMLEQAVTALIARGYLIVAAVGNDGPTAPPLYPAAYAHVIGVTGVDAKRRVLLEALHGPQVTFAAAGADIQAANTEHAFADVRGTSFAAPVVAGLLAERVSAPDKAAADAAVQSLAQQAIDLGPPGKDLTYGFGLVGTDLTHVAMRGRSAIASVWCARSNDLTYGVGLLGSGRP